MKAFRLIAVILIFVLCTAEEWERVPSAQMKTHLRTIPQMRHSVGS